MNNDKLKNLSVRALSGAVLAAVMFGATLLSPWGYLALLLAITVVGVWEFYNLCNGCGYSPQRVLGLSISAMIFILGTGVFTYTVLGKTDYADATIIFVALTFLFLAVPTSFICELFRNEKNPIANIGVTIMGAIYVALPATFMMFVPLLLSGDNSWNPWYALSYILIIWANDVFAYLTGMTLGKHRICERISPKKSWEGFVGGVLAAVAVAIILARLLDGDFVVWGGLGVIIAVTGVAGDFVESLFKRSASVKDSGAIMPGHGGMLDRFDALLISAPFALLYLILIM